MIIGHNPGIQDVALALAAGGPALAGLREKFPTGALATLKLDIERWRDLDHGMATATTMVTRRSGIRGRSVTTADRHARGPTTRRWDRSPQPIPTVEEAPVMLVGEQHGCVLQRNPASVVDLVRRFERAPGGRHLPVADRFRSSLPVTVGAGPDLAAQPAP